MRWIARLEPRLGWMAFPGLLRFYAILTALVFVLQVMRPDIGALLDFNLGKILQGEVWRVVTFIFASSGFGSAWPLPIAVLFMLILVRISFMISDALEGAWGVFRTTLFFYCGILGLIIGNTIFLGAMTGTGAFIFGSAFFAFATLYPRVEFLMFFVLPVQVRFLAMIGAVFALAQMTDLLIHGVWIAPIFYLLVYANYFLWAGLPALMGKKSLIKAAQRRRKFETAKRPKSDAFHECAICKRTDQTDPDLEFRISKDGKEYCLDHLVE